MPMYMCAYMHLHGLTLVLLEGDDAVSSSTDTRGDAASEIIEESS